MGAEEHAMNTSWIYPSGSRQLLRSVLRIAVSVYVGLGLLLYFFQAHFIFLPKQPIAETPEQWKMPYEETLLSVEGGQTSVWFLPVPEARGVVLYSHGNAGNMGDRGSWADVLRGLGLSVCMYDYGGYGKSTGSPSESRCYADARAVWNYLTKEKGIPPNQIILFGHSLGGGPTTQLATEVQPAGVVLDSAFRSVAAMAQATYRVYPAWLLVRHRFDNESKMPDIHAPLLIIHSRTDEIVPFSQGQALFEKANSPKRFVEIHGGHNTGFLESIKVYAPAWQQFLEECLPKPADPAADPAAASEGEGAPR